MFCTYLTVYRGNKLPPFYVGSTSISKIKDGYRGSVSSREFKLIWKSEIKNNPQLFKTIIISVHNTRDEALIKENEFHLKLNISKNNLYINKANAIPNGVFGIDNSGKNNPMYGRKRQDCSVRMKVENPMFDENTSTKVKIKKENLRKLGKHASTKNFTDTILKTSIRMQDRNPSKIKCCCIICGRVTTLSAITRFHKHKE